MNAYQLSQQPIKQTEERPIHLKPLHYGSDFKALSEGVFPPLGFIYILNIDLLAKHFGCSKKMSQLSLQW